MLRFFRALSIVEGLSFLVILSVTLGAISREYVFPIGMAHGVLFLLYLVSSLLVCNQQNWSLKIWLPLFLASIVPFAFVPVEFFLRKASLKLAPAPA
ncbi:MAG: DUF3817 domain-containing protein [Gammaproteobacteria bacterium]|nr:DUF3817 domain-containing protein [Gammaproteobacteria bacterium]